MVKGKLNMPVVGTVVRSIPLILIMCFLLLQGCRAVVVPPESPEQPETVYLVDHVYHAALVLPESDGRWVRYEFGEWHYFGHNRTGLFYTINALAWPSDGALGRRYVRSDATGKSIEKQLIGTHVYKIRVPRKRVRRLRNQLSKLFAQEKETMFENVRRNLKFVRQSRSYWFMHDSNNEVERWLHVLGCTVYGSSFLSNWTVERAGGTPSE